MARLIVLGGKQFPRLLRKENEDYLKKEPAAAKLLGLEGDPYLAVLALADVEDEGLETLLKQSFAPTFLPS